MASCVDRRRALFRKRRRRGATGTPQPPPPPPPRPKKRPNPRRGGRVGTGLFGAGKAPPPAPRLGTPVAAASAPRSSANWPPNGRSLLAPTGRRRVPIDERGVANAETSTRPAAAMFPDSLFNTSGGDFDPWSAMGGRGSSLAGVAAPRPSPSRPASNGRNRWDPSEGLGQVRVRPGRRGGCGRRDTNTQAHTQAAQASSTQVAGGALLSSGGGVLPKPRTTAPRVRRRRTRRREEVTEGRDIERSVDVALPTTSTRNVESGQSQQESRNFDFAFMNTPDKCLRLYALTREFDQSVRETYSCWLPRRRGCW